jgi:hypothetical protein
MTQPPSTPSTRTTSAPVLDVAAVLAALQDQIDDLQATVEAQQAAIERLLEARRGPS